MLRRSRCLAAACVLMSLGYVSAMASQPVETSETPKTQLYVRTVTPGAKIKLDGKPQGTSDHLFRVPPDVHKMTIEVELDGHNPKQKTVEIRGGWITRVELELEKRTHHVSVPPNAIVRVLNAHTDTVGAVAFSPDGLLLASGGNDKAIKLWDTVNGELLRTLEGHTHHVHCVAFSPDGSILASSSHDKTVRLWDVTTGKVLHTLAGHTAGVQSVAFNLDGSLLASGSHDGTVRIWCLKRILDNSSAIPGIVKPGNVALASNGAKVFGVRADYAALLDGSVGLQRYAWSPWPCEWTVILDQVYRLQQIRMKLWDGDKRYYRYTVEISADGKKFEPLADRSKGQWKSWQFINFPPRPVKAIRIHGLYNSINPEFHLTELEAYCLLPGGLLDSKPAEYHACVLGQYCMQYKKNPHPFAFVGQPVRDLYTEKIRRAMAGKIDQTEMAWVGKGYIYAPQDGEYLIVAKGFRIEIDGMFTGISHGDESVKYPLKKGLHEIRLQTGSHGQPYIHSAHFTLLDSNETPVPIVNLKSDIESFLAQTVEGKPITELSGWKMSGETRVKLDR